MNTMVKAGLGVVAAVGLGVVGVVGYAASQPDTLSLERSVVVQAPVDTVRPLARDLRAFVTWSPWSGIDPDVQQSFSETSAGLGAWYAWEGNDDVGAGKMTVIEDDAEHVAHELAFLRPFEDTARSAIAWTAEGESTRVVWTFEQEAGLGTKLANLLMDIEGMLAADYDKGLGRLKSKAEAL